MPCSVAGHSYPWPSPPHALTNVPTLSNSSTGGAAWALFASGRLRGRWTIQTWSPGPTATDDTGPRIHLSGIFGHAGSTSKIGARFDAGDCFAGAWVKVV